MQYRTNLATGSWQKLADVSAPPTNSRVQVIDTPTGASQRFYRLVTPKLP
jgi:hypothetical protein